MANGRPRTLSDYRKAIREAQARIWGSIKEYGELLVAAKKDLSAMDWETLYNELRQDQTKAELEAAMAVGDGGLDERLFPAGVIHSKVMNMTREDQGRLLSGERFQVFSDRSPHAADADEKTWAEMSKEQRSRLISDKGGRILPLAEQRPPRTAGRKHIEVYLAATYRAGDDYITLHNGEREGRLNISSLKQSLTAADHAALLGALK